ncbi:sensor histidine kinase [Actinacidiphila bryophytorum]|uniref:sensor histidine kinase n=1 Tax=Actinacidiphila bryophytorum TaxID=1436133 RepID=UPI0027DEA87C|nr:histidine kinase [Actinacidiphila bryophytorum]
MVALGRVAVLSAVASAGAVPLVSLLSVLRGLLSDGTRQITLHGPYHTWAMLGLVLLGLGVVRMRWVVRHTRRLVGKWCGVVIAEPYRPAPTGDPVSRWQRIGWLLSDPATWRDLLWTGLNAVGGFLLLLIPAGALLAFSFGYLLRAPSSGPPDESAPSAPPSDPSAPPLPAHSGRPLAGPIHSLLAADPVALCLALMLCGLLVAAALLAAPRLLTGYGHLAGRLLGPTREAQLAQRVDHLAATRSDTIDSGAAAMRRIERDLHDGAQARLVAMGMTLNSAEQLFESNPQAALALLTEARNSSVKALAELRDLVRGIHPPVLADRGLGDALRALALDLPLHAQVDGVLPARAPAAVESAAYFAVNELLANVSKHAGAARVWIDIGHTGEALRIGITDDGRGGADPTRGTGLRGLERRLATFDGVLAVSSPPGGPTIASLEIPCVLSSPKTSSS